MNGQLCLDLGHALPVCGSHPPSHISLDGLAVTTHFTAPSSLLCHRNGGALTLLAEGVVCSRYYSKYNILY